MGQAFFSGITPATIIPAMLHANSVMPTGAILFQHSQRR
jgi:hypothetical protein